MSCAAAMKRAKRAGALCNYGIAMRCDLERSREEPLGREEDDRAL